MALHQINLRIEEGLLTRFKAEAKARGISANAAAALAFEGWLAGDQAAASKDKQSKLTEVLRRLEMLERRLAQTDHQPPHPPAATAAAPPLEVEAPTPISTLPPRRLTHDEARGMLTTKEVVQALGLASESSLTNWIRRNGHDCAIGKAFKGYLLLGKGLMPGAGKPVWLWRRG